MSTPIKIYSWSPVAHATPMVWADCRNNPLTEPAGECVLLWQNKSDLRQREWSLAYFAARQFAGDKISRVCLDDEGGCNWWQIGGGDYGLANDYVERWLNDLRNLRYGSLYQALAATQPETEWTGTNTRRVLAWNRIAGQIQRDALMFSVVNPAQYALGSKVRISNYGEVLPGTPDENGWISHSALSLDGIYSPALYLRMGNTLRYPPKPLKKHWRWNRMIQHLNVVREAVRDERFVSPWVSYPGFNGDGQPSDHSLWPQLIQHTVATGVRELKYWNPFEFHVDESLAAELFPTLMVRRELYLDPIPLDADEIVTGEVRTIYREAL